MARLGHEIEYAAARFGVTVARLLGPALADRFGSTLGKAAYHLVSSRRRIAMDNLARAFGDELTPEQCERLTREVFRNIGCTWLDFARLGKTFRNNPEKLFDGGEVEALRQAREAGKGAIVVGGHFGSLEMWGLWTAVQGFKANLFVGMQSNRKVDEMINDFRRELGVGIIYTNQGVGEVVRALRRNELVAIAPDQHSPGGLTIDFFGRPAATARGPAVFSIRSGAPIVPVVLRRERYDRHVVMAGEAICPPKDGDLESRVRRMTSAYTEFFEDCIRMYPEQWWWTHRRWKI